MAATTRFQALELRTTDVAAARGFYAHVLGSDFWRPEVALSPLPERALAAGARPHWAGHLGVDDPLRCLELVVERGGQQLGPTLRDNQGAPYAFVRDPFGAMLALGARHDQAEDAASWHMLHVTDHEAALAFYVELFGWHPRQERELPGNEGHRHRFFAWNESGGVVGSVTNAARTPQIHHQWLHFFGTPSVSSACAAVRAHGALALEPTRTESGDAFAACDDLQGAAFGLHELAVR